MKIAILCPTFYSFQGVSRVAERQAKEFANGGDEVVIFTLKANMEPPQNVKLQVLGMPDSFLAQRLYRLLFPLDLIKAIRWVPKLKGFDVTYSYEYPLHWLAYLAKKLYGVKYIHYNSHFNPPDAFPSLVERTYVDLRFVLEKWLIKKADSAISISQYSRQMLKEKIGVDSEVIYCKIDSQRFHLGIDKTKIRQKHNLGNSTVVLFVGHISPTKGVHLLIRAFNIVRRQVPQAKLLIVGSHPYKNYSQKLKQMSDDSVIFSGEVPDDELPYYYAACDVYATASLWEGFNLPLAEAQACGKPVVAFDIGPHPEVVKDKQSGILVRPGDINAMVEAIIHFLKF